MNASVRQSVIVARLMLLTMLCSVGLLLVGPAGSAYASGTGGKHTGVQGLTTVLRAGRKGIDMFIAWTPPTAEQQRGLTWTSVYFGDNSQPVLVFPPDAEATITDVPPGTYRLGVEFDYGPRSSYTHSARHQMSVTVPETLPVSAASAPAANTAPQAEPTPQSTRKSLARRVQGSATGTLLVGGLLAAGLLTVAGGVRGVRRRRRRVS